MCPPTCRPRLWELTLGPPCLAPGGASLVPAACLAAAALPEVPAGVWAAAAIADASPEAPPLLPATVLGVWPSPSAASDWRLPVRALPSAASMVQ